MRLLRILLPLLALAGCKQPIGGRCQIDSDCESGRCSNAEPKTCRQTTETLADAAPDARSIDAATGDGAQDVDAAPPVDAATTDAL